jgi:6-phosphogluconate dehydrogenase
VFDQNPAAIKSVTGAAVTAGADLKQLVGQLDKPRAVWVMLPAGAITEDTMIGGEQETIAHLDPIFDALAPGAGDIPITPGRTGRDPRVERGFVHCGPSGAGRFVKMIHNGIEYGLMQAYAEGFNILSGAASKDLPEEARYNLDLPDIAEVWRRGSVIGSWLLDLTAMAFAEDPKLARFSGFVEDSGEGRWTIMAAIEEAVPSDVLSAALYARFRSRETDNLADKLLSAMRNKFGGHVEPKTET